MRDPGLYWVIFDRQKGWEPAKFSVSYDGDFQWWEIIGDDEGYGDEDFVEIGRRMITPS